MESPAAKKVLEELEKASDRLGRLSDILSTSAVFMLVFELAAATLSREWKYGYVAIITAATLAAVGYLALSRKESFEPTIEQMLIEMIRRTSPGWGEPRRREVFAVLMAISDAELAPGSVQSPTGISSYTGIPIERIRDILISLAKSGVVVFQQGPTEESVSFAHVLIRDVLSKDRRQFALYMMSPEGTRQHK